MEPAIIPQKDLPSPTPSLSATAGKANPTPPPQNTVFPAQGGLVLVPTPLGNLNDLTPRAADALKEADLILAEDTRRTAILLHHLGIKKQLLSFHDHNETLRTPEVLKKLVSGLKVALVSDAGMPCLSDPGFHLVRACLNEGLPVSALPGASAITTALAASGLPPVPFYFGGFLPVKAGRRRRELEAALARGMTHVYFESPHRLMATLSELAALQPDSKVCVARELTKIYEEFCRGTPAEIIARFASTPPRGEITLVLAPAQTPLKPPLPPHGDI